MAELDFDEKKVESVIEKLNSAKDSLSNVIDGMVSGLNLIARARGASYVDTNALKEGIKVPENCTIEIQNMIDTIKNAAEEIIKYNGDVSKMNIFQRGLGTLGMIGSKTIEGIFTAGEQLVDGFASLIGWGAGALGFKGAQEKIGNFVKKDYVGDAFHNFYYKTGLGSAITKSSYIKEDGKIANFTKGIGTAIGYAGAIYLTGGLAGVAGGGTFAAGATAASSSLAVTATAAGIGGMGGTMQAGLGMGMSYNDAFKVGVKNGLISAGTVVVLNQAIKAVSNKIQAKKAGTSLEKTGGANGSGPTGSGPTGSGPTGTSGGGAGTATLNTADDVINNTTMSAGEKIDMLKQMRDSGQISKADFARGIKATHPDTAGQSVMTEPKPTGNASSIKLDDVAEASTKLTGETSAVSNTASVMSEPTPAATNLTAKVGEAPVASHTPSVISETPTAATQLPAKLGEAPAATNLSTTVAKTPTVQGTTALTPIANSPAVPAVVAKTPAVPTVVAKAPIVTGSAVPAVITETAVASNTLATVSNSGALPTVVSKTATTSNVPAVVAETQTLPAVIKETPNSLVVAQNEVQLPAVIDKTSNVPAVVSETAAVPAVIDPVPNVSTPVIAKTPVIPVPPYTDPGTMPPAELKTASMTLDPVATTPISGTPANNTGGTTGGNTGGNIGGGSTVIPVTTPTPTTPVTTPVTTPTTPVTTAPTIPPTTQPNVIPEYESIPDTMVGKKSVTDYIAPALAGAAVGLAGAAIASKRENYNAEYLENNDDDDDESHDYDDDFFDKVEE